MVIAAAIAANLFNGLNMRIWNGWVFFAVFIGIVLVLAYTVRPYSLIDFGYRPSNPLSQAIYSTISPGWFVTPIYGNYHFLFRSAFFWLGIPITVILALLPRYLYIAWSFCFHPNDLDILNWNHKLNPNMDLIREVYLHSEPEEALIQDPTPPQSATSGPLRRPSMQYSQIDMSTGVRSRSRGYSFAQEENGVAMRRMQSNLSGALLSPPPRSRMLRSIFRRKQPSGV